MTAAAKAALRRELRRQRAALELEPWMLRSASICRHLAELPCCREALGVALFWPMIERREVDLRALDAELRARGKHVLYYPFLSETAQGFRRSLGIDSLRANRWGFLEPGSESAEAEPGAIDVIVVPALALTPKGERLGYGAGFYDRVLPRFRPPAVVVGTCFESELREQLPQDPHDARVDWIVTELAVRQAEG